MNEFYSCADLEAESLKYTGEGNQASSESQLLSGQGAVSYSGSGSPDPALALEPSCLWLHSFSFLRRHPLFEKPISLQSSLIIEHVQLSCRQSYIWKPVGQD